MTMTIWDPGDGEGESYATFSCDQASLMDLLLLAQLYPEGYAAENGTVSKFIKAIADNKKISNPSGFTPINRPS